ncbi:MAG: hypothetical protein ACKVH0_17985 [Alphaproteobacteria bacterium]
MRSEWDDPFEQDAGGTVFRDVVMLALIGFMAMVVMMLPHLNPPKTEQEADHRAPGNLIIELHWPHDMRVDVDLWVKAPGDYPVGFWNQVGRVFSLLRDDLGGEGDATERNYEVVYSRGVPAGHYVVNVHMYGSLPKGLVVPVTVVTSVKKSVDASAKQILTRTLELTRHGQERTVYQFTLDSEAALDDASVTTLTERLITADQEEKSQ